MPLALVVEKLDGVDETVRQLYVEKDGKYHLDVTGVEDTSGLKSALQKERDAVKEAKRIAKELEQRYAGIDPDKVRDLMSKFDAEGEAALIAAGKIDEVINNRTEKLRKEMLKQVEAEATKTEAALQRANKFSQRVLDNHIRAAAAKVGLHSHAIEDALFRGRSMFSLNDDGDAIQLASDGRPILGKDGKTPFSPGEWLEGMKELAPHWFPAGSTGAGAAGSGSGTGGAKQITRAAFNALSAAERATIVKTHKIVDA